VDVFATVRAVLAADLACDEDDLLASGVGVVLAQGPPTGRQELAHLSNSTSKARGEVGWKKFWPASTWSFVTGGYPLFLLEHAQRTGFVTLVRQRVRQSRLAYAGISAGASLASPDLALFRAPDDPGVVTDSEGLALAPFFPLTHANRGRQEWYAEIIATNRGSRFVTLTDEQAVVIAGDAWEVRESLIIDAGSC
jgi:hypothetical protein